MRVPYPRFVEGIRWLRSDGTPNFSNRVYKVESDLERLAVRPVRVATPTTPIMKAIETMYEYGIRSLIITNTNGYYEGVLLAEHICNYFGGGEKYDIVVNSFDNDFFKAVNAPVSLIYERGYPSVLLKEKLTQIIQLMISEGLTLLPVLHENGRVYGIISEHDIVGFISQKRTGVKVSDIMSDKIVSVESGASLREALNIMEKTGLRGLFVRNEAGQIIGTLKTKDIINAVGSHKAFSYLKKGYLDDFTSVPVNEFAKFNALTIDQHADVGDLASMLLDRQEYLALVVTGDGDPIGMVTEHDVFYALALPM